MKLNTLSLAELKNCLESGQGTAVEVVNQTLEAIHAAADGNYFITVGDTETLVKQAEQIDAARTSGSTDSTLTGPLAGVPIAIKDNICVRDIPLTAGSRMLAKFVSPYDATVVERLKNAGAILIGKTNLDEFAMGSFSETSFFGVVKNPRVAGATPGGSSGGSAAAVAADLCAAALGSDTGGSVRMPASHTGTVGLKPTYGRVSRSGVIAFASSMDQVGPMAKTVEDAAILLEIIAGHDPKDATSSTLAVPKFRDFALNGAKNGIEGMKIGIPAEYFDESLKIDPIARTQIELALEQLKNAGAILVDLSLAHADFAAATYHVIAAAEASSNLARFDGVRFGHRSEHANNLTELYERSRAEGFGEEVKRRILLGTLLLSEGYYAKYFQKAQKVRTLIARDFHQAFQSVDIIAAPTSPCSKFLLNRDHSDPSTSLNADRVNVAVNLAGLPAISVPCGDSVKDPNLARPVGLQFIAPAFEEGRLFQAAACLENLLNKSRSKA